LGKSLSTAIGPDKVDDSGFFAECKNKYANQKLRYDVGGSDKVMIVLRGKNRANQQNSEASSEKNSEDQV
jgi:hypothetical protein